MEVADGIHRIETAFAGRTNAVHYLWGEHRSMLVDATTRTSATDVLAAIDALGAPLPHYVVSTHSDWDHVGGNGTIRAAAPAAIFVAHLADRRMIEHVDVMIDDRYGEFAHDHGFDESDESKQAVRDGTAETLLDVAVVGGEEFQLGPDWTVTLRHTAGHSRGSISVDDPRSDCLIVGDAVLGAAVPLSSGAPAFPPTYRYLDDYLGTVDWMRSRAPELLLTGHYPVYTASAVTEFLEETREFTERAEAALEAALRTGEPRGLLEVAAALSAELGDWPAAAAPALLFPLSGHLDRMLADRRVRAIREQSDGQLRYKWTSS